ncbi:hypothetical protein ACIBQ1_36015 [Nonomuraea sp. NPDC050153]|uniref:hypothetical protein n=1 Tax=Nonomuraea sp. NPDC050153 TaxID=3364359 RepID=UPI00378A54B4
MAGEAGLGRDFGWLWRAFAVSALGTGLALDAIPLVAILALGISATEVSWISAAGHRGGRGPADRDGRPAALAGAGGGRLSVAPPPANTESIRN